jgi:phosphatidylethanolamine/phosphatidyl-N-methylethanolamine N-methyltransferase
MSRSSAANRATIESRRIERAYSLLARVYDDFFDWALGPGRRQAVARLPIRPGERILEVGVGTGLSLPHYPPGCHITGIDISEPMLDQARERAESLGRNDVDLRLMDARDLAFPDANFDHVVAPYVISVVPEPERVMSEIGRVCRSDGTVIVVNHFLSPNLLLGLLERATTPASRYIGFRLDLPISVVTKTPGLETTDVQKVNMFGLWRLLLMRRTA